MLTPMDGNVILITEYILKHGDALRDDLVSRKLPGADAAEIASLFNDAVIEEMRHEIGNALGLPYEQIAEVVTVDYVDKLLGMENS